MKYLAMALIRAYQLTISPLLGPICRFYPSCSHYGYEAFRRHGFLRGAALTTWRLLRCNPWNAGGVDFVPEPRTRRFRGDGRLPSSEPGSSTTSSNAAPACASARIQAPQGAAR